LVPGEGREEEIENRRLCAERQQKKPLGKGCNTEDALLNGRILIEPKSGSGFIRQSRWGKNTSIPNPNEGKYGMGSDTKRVSFIVGPNCERTEGAEAAD